MHNHEKIKAYHQQLVNTFSTTCDPSRAPFQEQYMKSKIPYWGIKTPEVRKIVRTLNQNTELQNAFEWTALIDYIWEQSKKREEWYAAIEIYIDPRFKKWVKTDTIPTVEKIVTEGAWWDIIDPMAIKGAFQMLQNEPTSTKNILGEWSKSENIWKRRIAILTQLHSKSNTDWEFQQKVMEPSITNHEFFLQKAIGWALRQYSRTNPRIVEEYVEIHSKELSKLAVREGLKLINKKFS